jgi:hypothetical protein
MGALACVACVEDRAELFPTLAGGAPPYAAPAQPGATDAAAAPGAGAENTPSDPNSPAIDEAGVSGALPIGQPTPPATNPGGAEPVPGSDGAPTDGSEPPPANPVPDVNSARTCPAVSDPVLLDFEVPGNSTEQALFGDFNLAFSGGTFVFPQLSAGTLQADPAASGIESNVSEGDWHVFGNVSQDSGFGLFFNCQLLDASAFVGVAFHVQGSVALDQTLSVFVGSASQEVAHEWFVEQGNGTVASFGRCFPAQSQYDGTCQAPGVSIAVSAEGADVIVPFTDFLDGRPSPGVDPAELTSFQWKLPQATRDAAGAALPYAVDLHIDDIRFVTSLTPEPPAAPATEPPATEPPAAPDPTPPDPTAPPPDPTTPPEPTPPEPAPAADSADAQEQAAASDAPAEPGAP